MNDDLKPGDLVVLSPSWPGDFPGPHPIRTVKSVKTIGSTITGIELEDSPGQFFYLDAFVHADVQDFVNQPRFEGPNK